MMKREFEIGPAYDKRNLDPKKDYGIHGVELRFFVSNEQGGVQFIIYTGWLLPSTIGIDNQNNMYKYSEALLAKNGRLAGYYPSASDLGYHSPKPMYEDHTPIEGCKFFNGAPCYYDGSSLNAVKPFKIMLEEGSEAVWTYLENYHKEIFGEVEDGEND